MVRSNKVETKSVLSDNILQNMATSLGQDTAQLASLANTLYNSNASIGTPLASYLISTSPAIPAKYNITFAVPLARPSSPSLLTLIVNPFLFTGGLAGSHNTLNALSANQNLNTVSALNAAVTSLANFQVRDWA